MTVHVVGMFCEDIREEKNGQVSIIGVLPDNIMAPPIPELLKGKVAAAIIPKLGLYVRVGISVDDEFVGPVLMSLSLPDGSSLNMGELETELIEKSKREAREAGVPLAGVIFNAIMQGFQLPGSGLIVAVAEYGGTKHQVAVIKVRDRPPAKA